MYQEELRVISLQGNAYLTVSAVTGGTKSMILERERDVDRT